MDVLSFDTIALCIIALAIGREAVVRLRHFRMTRMAIGA